MNSNCEKQMTSGLAQVYRNNIFYQRKNGYSPTVRELCELVGVSSTSTIVAYLKSLEHSGFIRRRQSSPRAIEIL